MTIAIWTLSIVLVAEFIASPMHLWNGRNMHFFTEFTGLKPSTGRVVFAPAMLVSAVLLAVGLIFHPLGVAGAAIITGICAIILVRLAAPTRRSPLGILAYTLFGGLSAALMILQRGQ